jgi:hypothetical protein
MGIDEHTLRFLQYSSKRARLGRVATLGRQELHVDERRLKELLRVRANYRHEKYTESLLMEYFGARCVESFDNSGFEGATHIVDMNEPLPRRFEGYDTILDVGSLEHIYKAAQALVNISELGKAGAQIVHVLPANNYCGHGFWQISPELFFTLYSEPNGYRDTKVFLASRRDVRFWYEVKRPENGRRAVVRSSSPVLVLCRTTVGGSFHHRAVQQSDYVSAWRNGCRELPAVERKVRWATLKVVARRLLSGGIGEPRLGWLSERSPWRSLSEWNPSLVRHEVSALVGECRE